MTERLRVLVLGYVLRCPIGGMTWHYLQYAMGLARLGHDVHYLETCDYHPAIYDPRADTMTDDPSYSLDYAARVFDRIGLGERWAFHHERSGGWIGPAAERVDDVIDGADLLLNVSGACPVREWFDGVTVRAFIDTDPAFQQIRNVTLPDRRALTERHDRFFTFGSGVAEGIARVPDDGFPWIATRQPVVLDAWPATPAPAGAPVTTILNWDSYPPREHEGRRYGLKSHSFPPYFDLPSRTDVPLELAVGSPTAPREELRRAGWSLRNPLEVSRDPFTYRDYIQASLAEFSIAKEGYVVGRTGWFSERSAAYLASGRPVVAQETGFSRWIETGEGLLAFQDPDGAAAALEDLAARYEVHARAAREIAAETFDSDRVLAKLLEAALSSEVPSGTPRSRSTGTGIPAPRSAGR